MHKGAKLYISYPKKGIEARTSEQQSIYKQELANYFNLIDCPLECSTIPTDLIGALYLFKDTVGNEYVFAIMMNQANSLQSISTFGLWFGLTDNVLVKQRVDLIQKFIDQNSLLSVMWKE